MRRTGWQPSRPSSGRSAATPGRRRTAWRSGRLGCTGGSSMCTTTIGSPRRLPCWGWSSRGRVDDIATTGKTFPGFATPGRRCWVSPRAIGEDDFDSYDRPRRHTRPRTKDRPSYPDAVSGFVVTVDRGRFTVRVGVRRRRPQRLRGEGAAAGTQGRRRRRRRAAGRRRLGRRRVAGPDHRGAGAYHGAAAQL